MKRVVLASMLVLSLLTGCGVTGGAEGAAPGAPIDIDGTWQVSSTIAESNVPDYPVGETFQVTWAISSSGDEVTVTPSTNSSFPITFTRSGNQLTLSDDYFGPYAEGTLNIQSASSFSGSFGVAAQGLRARLDFTGTRTQ